MPVSFYHNIVLFLINLCRRPLPRLAGTLLSLHMHSYVSTTPDRIESLRRFSKTTLSQEDTKASSKSDQGDEPRSSGHRFSSQLKPQQRQFTQIRDASSSSSTQSLSPSVPSGSDDVLSFLVSLQPPLPNLLPELTQLGFKDANYIKGFANWPGEDQSAFLKLYGPGGEGRFTSLDIAILMIGFRRVREGK